MRIERILCPTDLTPDSEEALRYALALARAYEAELLLMHCEHRVAPGAPAPTDSNAADRIQKALFRRLQDTGLNGLRWQSVVVTCDDAGDAITREASRYCADLIVMRSRRRPHRAALLGSIAESVCRTAPCPVLVTHSDERAWIDVSARQIQLQRVLVAYDFSDHAELALKLGLSAAQEYQAELHLVHVLPPFTLEEPEISWYPLGKEGSYHKAARRLQKAVPDEAYLWCHIKTAISEGQPYREILNYAEKHQIDLICLGAHGAGFGMRTLFGSNVDRVLRQAPCPVLVARPLKHAKRVNSEVRKSKIIREAETTARPAMAAIVKTP
jgi:nucleotide-binding universal stress UspA family protein